MHASLPMPVHRRPGYWPCVRTLAGVLGSDAADARRSSQLFGVVHWRTQTRLAFLCLSTLMRLYEFRVRLLVFERSIYLPMPCFRAGPGEAGPG